MRLLLRNHASKESRLKYLKVGKEKPTSIEIIQYPVNYPSKEEIQVR